MLVYSCSDLIFATKIRGTADALNVTSRPARNLDMLRARLERVDDGKANDAVTCVMVDMELGEHAFELIRLASSFEPPEAEGEEGYTKPQVIAFAPHVMVEAMAGAERVGADLVFARGSFTNQLPELVTRYGS
ncbi:MAG: hypothetical protein AAGH99_06885 [Planctomycetota bacterium]